MKAIIITVAGLSSRFSRSIGRETLKCIYSQNDYKTTLIYNLISNCGEYDYYVIVGGYKFEELYIFINNNMHRYKEKIILVNNPEYSTFGSGYSLYLGIKALENKSVDSIVFAEGDLFLDKKTILDINNEKSNLITINSENIESNKSVVLYINQDDFINYLYDLNHTLLEIKEPFKSIYNSGQVWKFLNPKKLFNIANSLTDDERQGTNLIIVQKYFQSLPKNDYKILKFLKWINCNTINDYKKAGF